MFEKKRKKINAEEFRLKEKVFNQKRKIRLETWNGKKQWNVEKQKCRIKKNEGEILKKEKRLKKTERKKKDDRNN